MSSVKSEGMPNTKLHFDTRERKCPICGKSFIPAPFHDWKINHYERLGGEYVSISKLVCTYSCMRKWEKAHGRAK